MKDDLHNHFKAQKNVVSDFNTKELKIILESLIVKLSHIADKYETLEMTKEADIYIAAVTMKDSIYTYPTLSDYALRKAGLKEQNFNGYRKHRENIPANLIDKVIEYEREYIIANYIEKNNYYRMLNGLPDHEDSNYIYTERTFKDVDNKKPIHEMSEDEILILEASGELDRLIKVHPDKHYLKHLTTYRKIPIVVARKAKPYTILSIKRDRTKQGSSDAFKALYKQAQDYVLACVYDEVYKITQPYYDSFVGLLIVSIASQRYLTNFFHLAIDREFFDKDIIKLLFESYGLPFYSNISLVYLSKVAKNLNRLLHFKATDQVFTNIFKLFDMKNVEIYKYYLLKERFIDRFSEPVFAYKEKYDNPNFITTVTTEYNGSEVKIDASDNVKQTLQLNKATVILTNNGKVLMKGDCTGFNINLNNSTFTEVKMPNDSRIVFITATDEDIMFLGEDGLVYLCGKNNGYSLGMKGEIKTITQHPTLYKIKQISLSLKGAVFVNDDNKAFICGKFFSTLKDYETDIIEPVDSTVQNVETSAMPYAGDAVYFVTADGYVYSGGDNKYGQLGQGFIYQNKDNGKYLTNILKVPNVYDVKSIYVKKTATYYHIKDGTVYAAGDDLKTVETVDDLAYQSNGFLFHIRPLQYIRYISTDVYGDNIIFVDQYNNIILDHTCDFCKKLFKTTDNTLSKVDIKMEHGIFNISCGSNSIILTTFKEKPTIVEDADAMYYLKFVQVDSDSRNVSMDMLNKENYLDYDEVVVNDVLWGDFDNKEILKSEVIKKEFNYVLTKYISMNSIYDLSELSFELCYLFRLMVDCKDNERYLYLDVPYVGKCKFFDVIVALFALSCYKMGFNGDIIDTTTKVLDVLGFNFNRDKFLIDDIIKMYHFDKKQYRAPHIGEERYELEQPKKVFKDHFDITNLYLDNKKVREKIWDRMYASKTIYEYNAYKRIYQATLITEYNTKMYADENGKLPKTYEEYLRNNSYKLYAFVKETNDENMIEQIDTMLIALENYLKTDDLKYVFINIPSLSADSLKRFIYYLIDVFKSYTVDLHSMNVIYHIDDKRIHNLKMVEDYLIQVTMEYMDTLNLDYADFFSDIQGHHESLEDRIKVRDDVLYKSTAKPEKGKTRVRRDIDDSLMMFANIPDNDKEYKLMLNDLVHEMYDVAVLDVNIMDKLKSDEKFKFEFVEYHIMKLKLKYETYINQYEEHRNYIEFKSKYTHDTAKTYYGRLKILNIMFCEVKTQHKDIVNIKEEMERCVNHE